jgi:hypothetical protein
VSSSTKNPLLEEIHDNLSCVTQIGTSNSASPIQESYFIDYARLKRSTDPETAVTHVITKPVNSSIDQVANILHYRPGSAVEYLITVMSS